jgi:branched-chain amino acid transport system permease protein
LTDRSFFWIVLGVLLAGSAVAHNLRRGASGRAFVALRESEPAAQASGIDLARYRVTAFALSALYAGIAGALYAYWAGYITADSFDLPLSISFVAMIVVGGLDSTLGAIAGALFLTALLEVLQGQARLAETLYGAIIVVVLLFLPGGLVQLLGSLRTWRRARRAGVSVERSHG